MLRRDKVILQIQEKCKKKEKTLCLVGMGGIGKTTLARKLSEDKIVKHMYKAVYFVKSGGDDFIMTCDMFKQFEPSQGIPRDLIEAKKKLEDFLSKNEAILVFDDIKRNTNIKTIMPLNVIFPSNGSTVVLITRIVEVLKDYALKDNIIHIKGLDKATSKELFQTSMCSKGELYDDFDDITEKIVKKCHGLLLSLKVMGAFLRGKMRLKC